MLSDWDYFDRARDGDEIAWKILFNKYYKLLLKITSLITGSIDTAKDLVQETFVRMIKVRLKHFDEDTLLKYELVLMTKDEENNIREHLEECQQCSETFNQIKNDVRLIGSYDPVTDPEIIPLLVKKKRVVTQWLKFAAILVIGFFAGFLTSNLSNFEKVVVVKQSIITKTLSQPTGSFKTCEQVDLRVRY